MKKYRIWIMRLVPIVFILVYVVSLSQIFYRNMINSATERSWEELATAHSETAEAIGTSLKTNLTMLDLAADAVMMNADPEDEGEVLSYLAGVQQESVFDRIDVILPDGSILMQNGDWVKDTGEKTYEELIRKGSHLSQRVPDHYTGKESIHAFSPVYDANGQPVAILGATIHCSTIAGLFSDTHYGGSAQLFLVDRRDGCLVLDEWHEQPGNINDMRVYYEDPQGYEGTDLIGDILVGGSGTLPYASQSYGDTAYIIYAPVAESDFTLAMVIRDDALFADVHKMEETFTWVGIIELILLILLAVWMFFMMRRALQTEKRAQKAELELHRQKEQELEAQYAAAAHRQEFMETLAANLPGGYHRCTTDHSFRVTFASKSFMDITGYTMEQLDAAHNGSYMGIVAPEDREYFMSLAPQLERDGYIDCSYRIYRRDGSVRWVQDTTQYVERDGEAYYQCALMDITERIEEIQQARRQAEASSQAKSTFLFNISHDIRTPMNAIKGFARIIEENAGDPQLVLDSVGKINQAGDSLMMLMNDVLDISRIERGKEEVNLQPLDLYEHGRNLYEMFAADMAAAGIDFTGGGDPDNTYVYCDELKLTRILMNMLSNAKKFTPAGGTVSFGGELLRSDGKHGTYRFYVKDTGIGMSPEFRKRAFEQFERERTSTESGIAGSGLGLAIIKMLAELMGGTVELKSELGKGTEISVILTLLLADREQIRREDGAGYKDLDMIGKRVLLVEDNDFNREIARYVLEGMKFTVEEAENGAVCLEKLMAAEAGTYDLILMDIQMPVMDGYTAAVEIRSLDDREKAAVPIVAMTANAFEEDRKKCLDMGMNGHVGKPFDMDSLIKVFSEVF